MALLWNVIEALLWAFIALLFVRMVISWVLVFSRSWRPSGGAAAALELTYSVTDPPLKFLQRLIPPLRIGRYLIDIAFYVLFFIAIVLASVVNSL